MPDLKSEMSKVLEAWEQDTQQPQEKQVQKTSPHIFKPTNNVTLETFNYVRDNPNKNSSEIRNALRQRGFNVGSVGSLITQFTKQGQFAKDHNGRYATTVREYTPLKSTKKFRSEGKRVNKIVQIKGKPKSAGIAALQVDATTPKPFSVTPWTTAGIISKLSVIQARALYDELKKIFGG
jgi:hypothetical protein